MRVASPLAGLTAWGSMFLPWWHISGLGPTVTVTPVMLLSMRGSEEVGGQLIQLSSGFYGLVVVSAGFIFLGGLAGVLRGFTKRKIVPLVAGILLLSAVNMLTYAFVYLKVAGAVLCLTPSLFGAPLGYGLSYGFALVTASAVVILLSTLHRV